MLEATYNSAAASVAASLGLPARYAHLAPVIFGACDGLGSDAPRAVGVLARARLAPKSRVLELACGKGRFAVLAATTLRARVSAIDACPEFIARARELAKSERADCRFTVADIRALPRARATYDAAVMIGWFGHEHAAPLLRTHVKPGGVYLFDDALPRDEGPARARIARAVAALGDKLLASRAITPAELRARIRRDCTLVAQGVEAAAAANPRLSRGLSRWFAGFQEGAGLLATQLRSGFWLVRRGG